MIHSFTPSGVEHRIDPWNERPLGVIHSFTPSGVEHIAAPFVRRFSEYVIHSFTPSGVEHKLLGIGVPVKMYR